MDAPTCKICGAAHWPRDGHKFPEAIRVTKPAGVTKLVTKSGRPKVHASNAAKQDAYRKRKSGQ